MTNDRLWNAAFWRRYDEVRSLLKQSTRNVFIDMANYRHHGSSFLHLLCHNDAPPSLIIAIDARCVSVGLKPWEVVDNDKETPLHCYACRGSDVVILSLAIVRFPSCLGDKNKDGYTPLDLAKNNNKKNQAAFVSTLEEVRISHC